MSEELRIVLVGAAKVAHDRMLEEVRSGMTSINSSRLINWIVADYFARYFQKRKNALCKAHFNERKYLLEAMKIEDPEQRRRALQEAARNLGLNRQRQKKERPEPQKNRAPSVEND
jgi:hypothetical protein